MSENTLIEKIEADAKVAIQKVQSDQEAAVAIIDKEAESQVAELESVHKKQLDKKLAHLELVAISRAKQAANIAVQSAKRDQIDSVFAEVSDELVSLPSDEYVKFFTARVSEIVPKDCDITVVHAPDSRLDETKDILKEVRLEGKVVADKSINAGLIVSTKDGVYDATLHRLFSEHKANMEMDVVTALNA